VADPQTVARTLPDHDRCDTHRGYKLSCEQYERLLARSGQLCEICRKSVAHTQSGKLNIDHSGPWWAVRGLLCTPCNTALRNGSAWLPGAAEYLANTWWLQECRRLGAPTALGDEPEIGSVIRDQFMTVWIRYADALWHPHGGRTGGGTATWGRIFDMRGPQNMVPFDVHGPGGSELLRWYADRASQAATDARAAALAVQREAEAYEQGRRDCASLVLAEITDGDREKYIEWADDDGWNEAHGGQPQTEADRLAGAATTAMNDIYTDLYWLQDRIVGVLENLPGEVGAIALMTARSQLYDRRGPDFSRCLFANEALRQLTYAMCFRDAQDYLTALPDDHHQAWLEYAATVSPDDDGPISLIVWAARHARKTAEGLILKKMCQGQGPVIAACPSLGSYLARFDGCCPGRDEDHQHGLCEMHLEQAMSGTLVAHDGRPRVLVDYVAIPKPEKAEVPF
jgi:Recombination endonuclease VII